MSLSLFLRPLRWVRQGYRRWRLPRWNAVGKEEHELQYWQDRWATEGTLSNRHYEYFFTGFFGIPCDFYAGKRVLDIGCGPRGSLEWADQAVERVGLDPLAGKYRSLGADRHRMRYVEASSGKIPFEAGHFDVVTTFNSLDHVEDLEATLREMARVLRSGGTLLVIVEVQHPPTPTEPLTLPWEVAALFEPFAEVQQQAWYEIGDHQIYRQLRNRVRFDASRGRDRPAIYTGEFRRR